MKEIFINRLKQLMAGMSVTQMSRKTQIPVSTLSLYLSGKRNPIAENIVKIAVFFNVSSDYLLGITDDPNAKGEMPSDYHKLKDIEKKYMILREKLSDIYDSMD